MAQAVSIPGILGAAGDVIAGVNQVASGQGASGAPEKSAVAATNAATTPGYSLQFGNTTGLLTRILKVIIGGFLLLAGILKLSGKQDVIMAAGKKAIEGAALA